jgi:hypothetical protein
MQTVEKCIIYSQLRDLTIFFCSRPKFYKNLSDQKKNTFLMILNDCQVSRIWMNPRPIHGKTLQE